MRRCTGRALRMPRRLIGQADALLEAAVLLPLFRAERGEPSRAERDAKKIYTLLGALFDVMKEHGVEVVLPEVLAAELPSRTFLPGKTSDDAKKGAKRKNKKE